MLAWTSVNDVNSSKINSRLARAPDEHRPTTAPTNSSRAAMMIRPITSPNKICSGARCVRRHTNRREHFRRGSVLRQVIVGLTLICRSSYRGVVEFLRDLLGVSVSIGCVHDVLQSATRQADIINRQQDLSGIRVGLHDEVFQGATPVLVGVNAALLTIIARSSRSRTSSSRRSTTG